MSRTALAAALGLGFVALAGSSPAQAFPAEQLNAHIPFAFQIRDVTLPAGDYTIEQVNLNDQRLLSIRSKDGRHAVYFYVDDVAPRTRSGQAQLVFDRLGVADFLRSIRVPEEGRASISTAPAEVAAARKVASESQSPSSSGAGSR